MKAWLHRYDIAYVTSSRMVQTKRRREYNNTAAGRQSSEVHRSSNQKSIIRISRQCVPNAKKDLDCSPPIVQRRQPGRYRSSVSTIKKAYRLLWTRRHRQMCRRDIIRGLEVAISTYCTHTNTMDHESDMGTNNTPSKSSSRCPSAVPRVDAGLSIYQSRERQM